MTALRSARAGLLQGLRPGLTAGAIAALVLLLAQAALASIPPASWWLSVGDMRAEDGPAGAPVILHVDRAIRRPFRGEWAVVVRSAETLATSAACPPARGGSGYSPDARLPAPLTLDWWRDGAPCDLPPGRYTLRTCWTIYPAWRVLGDRHLCTGRVPFTLS